MGKLLKGLLHKDVIVIMAFNPMSGQNKALTGTLAGYNDHGDLKIEQLYKTVVVTREEYRWIETKGSDAVN